MKCIQLKVIGLKAFAIFTLRFTPLRIHSISSLRVSGTAGKLEGALCSDGACVVVMVGISPGAAIGGGGGGGGGAADVAGGGGGGGCKCDTF